MKLRLIQKGTLILLIIIFIGGFLRLYKLDWGNGLYTHPDEYHIVGSVMQLSFPNQMHPHFFSYGTVTIYIIYFTKSLLGTLSLILNSKFLILNSFLIGRFYSAFFSTLTIVIVFKVSRLLFKNYWPALFAALLVALTPGLIQQAHFATPESNLIFFILGSMFFLIKFTQEQKVLSLYLSSVFLGLALGVKISSIVFLLPLLLITVLKNLKEVRRMIFLMSSSLLIILTTLAIVAPFIFLDFPAFKSNLEYEGRLALGKFPIFYTRQFINTVTFLFQWGKILPYTLGLSILGFGTVGLFFFILDVVKRRRSLTYLTVLISFLVLFVPNALLFAKWTRFLAPSFPFFAIFSAFLIYILNKKNKLISFFVAGLILITTSLWSLMFFSIYTKEDIRITASDWIINNLPEKSVLLIEEGNTIDIPFKGNLKRIGFNFYPLEEDKRLRTKIAGGIKESDYFIIQSRRVFMNHQRLPKLFPRTKKLYDSLFDGKLGFSQIGEFTSYPLLEIGNWKLEIRDEGAEETWSVFDHPVIRIFKKDKQLTITEYRKLLGDD